MGEAAVRAAMTLWRKAGVTSHISFPLSPQFHSQEGLRITPKTPPVLANAAETGAGHAGVYHTSCPAPTLVLFPQAHLFPVLL